VGAPSGAAPSKGAPSKGAPSKGAPSKGDKKAAARKSKEVPTEAEALAPVAADGAGGSPNAAAGGAKKELRKNSITLELGEAEAAGADKDGAGAPQVVDATQ
jgi:hypothetical protein